MTARRNAPTPLLAGHVLGAARGGRLPYPFDLALLWSLPVDAVRRAHEDLESAGRIRWDDASDTWRMW